jgi:uncharacterized protein
VADPSIAVLSVRADARLEVPPDEATLAYAVRAVADDKAAALRALGGRLEAATEALRDLGGVVREAGDERRPLAWLVTSTHSEPERRWEQRAERWVDTGRITASATLVVAVRDFALIDEVGNALATLEHVHMRTVDWSVDHDNPGWAQVRAAAVDAALAKARHYAAALGGSVLALEHLADVGLLGDGAARHSRHEVAFAAAAPDSGDDQDGPSLDPVPQELHAAIEARLTASVPPLG